MNNQSQIRLYLESKETNIVQINIKNLTKLLSYFNYKTKDLKAIYIAIDHDGSSYLTLNKIVKYFFETQYRKEIKSLYNFIKKENEVILFDDLKIFMKHIQAEEFALDNFESFIRKILNDSLKTSKTLNNSIQTTLNYSAFELFMNSQDNSLNKFSLLDDTQPLSHYYISSSHNTYLEQHQLVGKSSTDAYINVLKGGCRCVEIDCWDDTKNNIPIVSHGYTLTTEIPFSDVIRVINQYAFVKSEYPMIVTLENHCSKEMEAKMAQYMIDIFENKILLPTESKLKQLPLLKDLKNKIILRTKILNKTHPKLTKLIYLRNNKVIRTNDNALMSVSYDEDVITTINTKQKNILKEYTKTNLVRVYPHGTRFDSSNYNPIKSWSDGCQLVALNWQYNKVNMRLNKCFFRLNRESGYRLKPNYLRDITPEPTNVLNLKLRVWSGRFLLAASLQLKISIIGYSQDMGYKKSKIIKNNGLNPEWNEEFEFKLLRPHRDFVMIELFDKKKLIGYYCVKVDDIQIGYRNIPIEFLKNKGLKGNLFVKVDLE